MTVTLVFASLFAMATAQSAPPAPAPAPQTMPGEHPALRLPRPAAADIVARFMATCVDHAGDAAAQAAAGQRLGITWPYRLTTGIRRGSDQCTLVSTVADGVTTESLGALLETALRARGPARIRYATSPRIGTRMDGELTVAGRVFELTGNVGQPDGSPLPTTVLILFNGATPPR